jgi:hypothetical protein
MLFHFPNGEAAKGFAERHVKHVPDQDRLLHLHGSNRSSGEHASEMFLYVEKVREFRHS